MYRLVIIILVIAACLTGCKKEIKSSFAQKDPLSLTSANRNVTTTASPLQWQKCLGSTANDLGFSVAVVPNGNGYILAGNTLGNNGDVSGNHGGSDAWIVEIGLTGNISWQKTFGGTAGDYADAIISTSDGGFIFSGHTISNDGDLSGFTNHGDYDAWIVKINPDKSIAWQKTFGGSAYDDASSIIQTGDGGYLVAGSTNSNDVDFTGSHGNNDAWVLKLNSTGDLVWKKLYGGSLYDAANTILPVADGYMVCASSASNDGDLSGFSTHGGKDAWFFKINDTGDILWQKTYGGSNDDNGNGIRTKSDGSYVISATTASNNGDVTGNHGNVDTWVANITSSGSIVWQKCFGGADMDNAKIKDINAAGEIVVVGYTFSRNGDISGFKGGEDFWTLRLDANGNKLNSTVFGGKSSDTGEDGVATPDGMYLGVGRTESTSGDVSGNHGLSDLWVIKFKF